MNYIGKFIHAVFLLFLLAVAAAVPAFPVLKARLVIALPILLVFLLWGLSRTPRVRGLLLRIREGIDACPERLYTALILIVPAVIQIAAILIIRPVPVHDARFVIDQAVRFAQTGSMPPLTYYAPGQIWWYAAFFRVFGAGDLVAQLSHVPLAVLAVLVCYRTARQWTPDHARGLSALFALYPAWIFYILVTPYYFYLYTLLILLMVWAIGQALRDGQWLWAALAGLAAGTAALTKAVALIAPMQIAAAMMCGRVKRKALIILSFVLVMTAVLMPWSIRNYRVFNAWVPVCTSGGLVLLSANHPDSNGLYSPVPDETLIKTPENMLAHSRECEEEAWRIIREHPVFFLERAVKKFIHTWGNEATYAELINRRGKKAPWLDNAMASLSQTAWVGLVLSCVILILRGRAGARPSKEGVMICLLEIIILSNALVYLVYEGGARHHLPMVPLLLLWMTASKNGSNE